MALLLAPAIKAVMPLWLISLAVVSLGRAMEEELVPLETLPDAMLMRSRLAKDKVGVETARS